MFKVEKGKVPACKEQKQLMKFLRKTLDTEPIEIRSQKIYDAVAFMEKYFFPLHDFQRFFVAITVGLYYENGRLVFNQLFMLAGRGTGKNGLISALTFYFISDKNNIKEYNVDIVANSEDQAKRSFEDIYEVVNNNSRIKKAFRLTLEEVKYKVTNAAVKYYTSNAKTKDSLRSGCVIFDEIHQYENYDNIKVFTGGLGKKPEPRRIYITTDGYVRGSVLDDFKERAKRILDGEEAHNGFFPFLFKMDSIKEVKNKELWCKAIPRIDYDSHLRWEVETQYTDSLTNDDLKEDFLTKRMNLPYRQEAKEVASWEEILATNQPIPDLTGCECIGAVDFTSLRDFCSVGLLFKKNQKLYFLHHTFIHEKSLELTKYNININEAIDSGHASIIKNAPVVPASVIVEWFAEKAQQYYIKKVVADRYRFSALAEEFNKEGLTLSGIPSGSITHTKLHPLITTLFAEKNIVFGDDKLMRWYCNNVYVETAKNGNKTYLKIEEKKRKTDGFYAFIHAMSAESELTQEMESVKFYDVVTL